MERSTDQFIANLYRENYRALYLHAYSMLGQRPEVEVALQEAFLAACKNPEEFMRKENPITWMEKVIEKMALHILRERRYTAALFTSFEELAPGQEPSTLTEGSFELIDFCQSVVTKEELKLFLRIAEGSSTFADEADRLGIKLSTCYKRFERIRKKLQKAMDDYNKNEL